MEGEPLVVLAVALPTTKDTMKRATMASVTIATRRTCILEGGSGTVAVVVLMDLSFVGAPGASTCTSVVPLRIPA